MSLRLKNRIALFNTVAAAITMLLVFVTVYAVVYITTYKHLDNDIREEKEEIFSIISWKGDSLIMNVISEWEEREHNQAEVNPIFMQVVNSKGQLIFRSLNLQNNHLLFDDSLTSEVFFNIEFQGKKIRQGQFPIINKAGKLTGQLVIGISQVESALILSNLRLTFFIAFPLMLLIFYFVTSLAASRSIAPVKKLIQFAGTIHYNNINNRLPLPPNQDEIHQLTTTINDLLERIEIGLNREKQITADISHELRTPLTSIRGTLEVLIRKTREPHQYEEKVHQVIQEVDSMNRIIDQLLHLARLDSGILSIVKTSVYLNELLSKIKHKWLFRLNEKNMSLQIDIPNDAVVNTDSGLLEIMLGNIISNAFKYGHTNGTITCKWDDNEKRLSIIDNGPGIPQEHLPNLFKRFYRTDTSENSKIQGIGLGLYIVKTLSGLQEITINVESEINQGSNFSLQFKH
jgi:signal transduction histidine kinase